MTPRKIDLDGKEYFSIFNRRVKSNWEEQTGQTWSDLHGVYDEERQCFAVLPRKMKQKEVIVLIQEVLREGHRIQGVDFNLTVDQIFDLCETTKLEAEIYKDVFEKK